MSVAGKCMAWKNILDMRRAVDYLCSRPEVKADRIGCYGHSMGSTDTWLVGPWEPRLKCLVGNCCLPTYAAIHRTHILHCFPNFIPGWFQYGDTPDIAGLIAPRALHLNFGEKDDGSPIQEVREGVKTIARAYEQAGAADHFSCLHRRRRRPRPVAGDVATGQRLVPQKLGVMVSMSVGCALHTIFRLLDPMLVCHMHTLPASTSSVAASSAHEAKAWAGLSPEAGLPMMRIATASTGSNFTVNRVPSRMPLASVAVVAG